MNQGWKSCLLYSSVVLFVGGLIYILVESINAKNTGFETKTLWDWMELLFVPLVLAVGAAFFTWDAALKRGDPRVIGSLAYLTPLTSTLVLVLLGGRTLTWTSGLAMCLIVCGAVIGSLDLFRSLRPAGKGA